MAGHEELVAELPKLDKMSNATRLKLAKKRRSRQLKRYQDTVRTGGLSSPTSKKTPPKVTFVQCALFHEAVLQNDIIEVEKLICEDGVCANHSNADGLSGLHRCCIENTVELADILIKNGADLNARDIEGWTPLHAASACGSLAMINLLINEGADLVAVNHDDKMPVDVACDADIRYVMQQKMLEAGYTDDVCKFMRDSVPKTMLADLKDAVKNGKSVNIQDKYGATPLHVAAANGYTDVLEFLLSQPDINVNIQDNEGWTPFHAAVCWEQKEAMKMLAEKKANMETQDIHGDTPFAVSDVPEIRQYILDLKSQFTLPQSKSMTPANSIDELTVSGESRGRSRSLSVRRISLVNKNEISKMSNKDEQRMFRDTLEAEDIERSASGEAMLDDDMMLADMDDSIATKMSSHAHSGGPGPAPEVLETSLTHESLAKRSSAPHVPTYHKQHSMNEDGTLSKEIDDALDDREGRKKIVSILKNKNPTPVKRDTLLMEPAPLSPRDGRTKGSLRESRPSPSGPECCTVL